MKLFCNICKLAFSSEKPVCPQCKHSQQVRPVVKVHLLVVDPDGPIKGVNYNWRVACGDMTPTTITGMVMRTTERAAATCDACMKLVPLEDQEYQENQQCLSEPLSVDPTLVPTEMPQSDSDSVATASDTVSP